MSESKLSVRPFEISKWKLVTAFEKVKANYGSAGVDGESIAAFEANLRGNLYKLWNRLSSGSYFPAASPCGRNTEEGRRGQDPRCAYCGGQGRADDGSVVLGAGGGTAVPS